MTKVADIMTREVVTFSPDDSVAQTAGVLRENRISGAPVVDGGKVVGVISEADVMELLEAHDINLNTILPSPLDVLELPVRMKMGLDGAMDGIKKAALAKVGDIMSKPAYTIGPDSLVEEAAALMSRRRVNRLPVVEEEGGLVGIVTRGNVIGSF